MTRDLLLDRRGFERRTQVGRCGIAPGVVEPHAATAWLEADGGLVEQYHIYNPNQREAHVQVSLALDQGSAEPFSLTVPPTSAMTLVANDQKKKEGEAKRREDAAK